MKLPVTGPASRIPPKIWATLEIVLVWLVFCLYAGWPVPDPNEPHYLGKAKHFWNPDWVPHDFFFDSQDSHLVFYATLGWLSKWMSLSAFAWTGRLVTWGLMACAWQRLSWKIVPWRGWAIASAFLFVGCSEHGQMAGEWVVGGFEAKGLAYALVWSALGAIVIDRWNTALVLLGLASAFHVLVGGWSVVAAGVAWLWLGRDRPPLRSMLWGLAGGGLLALLGLWPVWALSSQADSQTVSEANEIYVVWRLPHHLRIQNFRDWFIVRNAMLLVSWLLLCRGTPMDPRQRRLRAFVGGAVGIAFVGAILSLALIPFPEVSNSVLRFYWFRLSDAMLPLGVALAAGCFLRSASFPTALARRLSWSILLLTAGGFFVESAWLRATQEVPRADKPGKLRRYHASENLPDDYSSQGLWHDWRMACEWAAAHTPSDAQFLTPREAQTFKWYAGRSEVVSWKDMPQDAEGIVEWWRRIRELHASGAPGGEEAWFDTLAERSEDDLRRLGRKYHAGYLLTSNEPPLDLKRVYQNNSYAVYELGE